MYYIQYVIFQYDIVTYFHCHYLIVTMVLIVLLELIQCDLSDVVYVIHMSPENSLIVMSKLMIVNYLSKIMIYFPLSILILSQINYIKFSNR